MANTPISNLKLGELGFMTATNLLKFPSKPTQPKMPEISINVRGV